MAAPIPDSHKRLLTEPVIANLATIMADGPSLIVRDIVFI